MTWTSAIQSFFLTAALAMQFGPKWARRFLLFEAVLLLALSFWLTLSCLQKSGFGMVALVAILHTLMVFGPTAVFSAAGIAAAWIAMRVMGIPTDGSVWTWLRQGRRVR